MGSSTQRKKEKGMQEKSDSEIPLEDESMAQS